MSMVRLTSRLSSSQPVLLRSLTLAVGRSFRPIVYGCTGYCHASEEVGSLFSSKPRCPTSTSRMASSWWPQSDRSTVSPGPLRVPGPIAVTVDISTRSSSSLRLNSALWYSVTFDVFPALPRISGRLILVPCRHLHQDYPLALYLTCSQARPLVNCCRLGRSSCIGCRCQHCSFRVSLVSTIIFYVTSASYCILIQLVVLSDRHTSRGCKKL